MIETLKRLFRPKRSTRAGVCANCMSTKTRIYASPTWGPRWHWCDECGHSWREKEEGEL